MINNINHQATADMLSASLPTESMNCRYQSKQCNNPRSLKKNGKFHNLCIEHREKANSNQRKLDRKKRERKAGSASSRPMKKMNITQVVPQKRHQLLTPTKAVGRPSVMTPQRPVASDLSQQSILVQTPRGEQNLSMDDFNFLVDCFASGQTPVATSGMSQSFSSLLQSPHFQKAAEKKSNLSWQTFVNEDWNQADILTKFHQDNKTNYLKPGVLGQELQNASRNVSDSNLARAA